MDFGPHKIATPPCHADGWPEVVYIRPISIEEGDLINGLRKHNKELEALATMVALRARTANGDRVWNNGMVSAWRKDCTMLPALAALAWAMIEDDNARGGDQGNPKTGDAGS